MLNEEGDEIDPLDAFMAAEVRRAAVTTSVQHRHADAQPAGALQGQAMLSQRLSGSGMLSLAKVQGAVPSLDVPPRGGCASHTSPPRAPLCLPGQVLPEVKAKEEEERKRAEEEKAKLQELMKVR